MSASLLRTEPPEPQTSRADLIAAFAHMVALSGRRRVTDLHVRKLLCYVRSKDRDGNGVARSLQQLADRLLLTVSTCRRIIQRAVKYFGLLKITHQRHIPGGQTVNRYSINWPTTSELADNTEKSRARSKRSLPITPPNARAATTTRPCGSHLASGSHRPNGPAICLARVAGLGTDHLTNPKRAVSPTICSRRTLKPVHLPHRKSACTLSPKTRSAPSSPIRPYGLSRAWDDVQSKLLRAMDCARSVGATSVQRVLMSIWRKLTKMRIQSDVCDMRTSLAMAANSNQPNTPTPTVPTPAATGNHAPATYDHAPATYDYPHDIKDHAPAINNSSSMPDYDSTYKPPPTALDLLAALDELLIAMEAAVVCANELQAASLQPSENSSSHIQRLMIQRAFVHVRIATRMAALLDDVKTLRATVQSDRNMEIARVQDTNEPPQQAK